MNYQNSSRDDQSAKQPDETAAPELTASQLTNLPPSPYTLPSPAAQQHSFHPPNQYPQQTGPPLPSTYNYNYNGQYSPYPPGYLNPHIAIPPGAYYNMPYLNQPSAIFPVFNPHVGHGPAPTTAIGPNGQVALGPDGTWQRVSSPLQQPVVAPADVVPDVKQSPTSAYPVGVHEMPS